MEKERIYRDNISRVIQNKKRDAVGIVDNRLNTNYLNAAPVQRVSEEDEETIQGKLSVPIQRNETGMPDNLKAGIENLSGFSMDDVRVHYNSSKPATVQALAYTQGTDIHIAPGQEKHLPHEAWHVAQQMAGRVSPTTNINGMPVNDNAELEHEADVMGEKAVGQRMNARDLATVSLNQIDSVTQGKLIYRGCELTKTEKQHFADILEVISTQDCTSESSQIFNCPNEEKETKEVYMNWLIDDPDYFYVGHFKDILNTLIRIAKQLKYKNETASSDKCARASIIYLYDKDANAMNCMNSEKEVSPHLANLVMERLDSIINLQLRDFSFDCYRDINGQIIEEKPDKQYRIYRTMTKKELDDGNTFRSLSETHKRGHAGEFMEAVRYSGDVFAEFDYQNPKDRVTLYNGDSGIRNNREAKFKKENEGSVFLPDGAVQYSATIHELYTPNPLFGGIGQPEFINRIPLIHSYLLGKKAGQNGLGVE